ncbi:MAG: BsuPI-related putative proteinase inhibitor [bacterium]
MPVNVFAMGGIPQEKSPQLEPIPLTLRLFTDKDVYASGENIRMTIIASNETTEKINANYSSGQAFDFRVFDEEGEEIWVWSYNKAFTAALRPFRLGVGEPFEVFYKWDQKDNLGEQLSSGRYYIEGEIALFPRLRTNRLPIVIK